MKMEIQHTKIYRLQQKQFFFFFFLAKAILREKPRVINTYTKRQERSQLNNLTLYLK